MSTDFKAFAQQWDSAFNAGDMTKLASFYSADGSVVPAGGARVDGNSDIAGFFSGLRDKGFSDHAIAVDKVVTKGDAAVATGSWKLSGPGDNGGKQQYSGNWVNVLARTGQDWHIVLHTWN